jgi:hypothetical protein
MIHDIKITMVRPSTKSRGWHKRRLQGMIQTVIRCLAFTDPFEFSQNAFDFKIDTDIQTDVAWREDTYILKVTLDLDDEHLEHFMKYLKNIRGLNTITLLSAPNYGTIST